MFPVRHQYRIHPRSGAGIRTLAASTFDDLAWIRSDRRLFRHVLMRTTRDWSDMPTGVEHDEKHFRR
ncbi:MAG: hypothetical protein A3D94_12810 [Alphaproteobacteria bacterium RIFCSPHIGHO2_12_FULL_66_14]|nr:MAG: hypothetical protein A3D94_12810 [Alphaproteobacteria bacterium RIFCSPHIGHO2_12_FULL_66_14]